MLFTDRVFVTADELDVIDGEFNLVAKAEKKDVTDSPNSILTQAINNAGSYFTARFQNFSGYLVGVGVNSNHVAAVLNILSTAINRPRALLHQIPVVEPDPTRLHFKRWVQYWCLHEFYQSVFARQLNDRYEKKMDHYAGQMARYWETLKGNGFPVILTPLAAPAAYWEYNSGIWNEDNISAVSGGTAVDDASWEVSVTWCSSPSYQGAGNQNNAESAGSVPKSLLVSAGNVIKVDITSLNPPVGTMTPAIGTAAGFYPPMPATHWNVYVGPSGGPWWLQNSSPLPIATKTYTLADAPVQTGFPQNAGQPAMYDFSAQNIIWRA